MEKGKPRNIVVNWSDVKRAFTAAIENGDHLETPQPIAEQIADWYSNPMRESDWEGGSPAETMKNVRTGYRAEHFAHSAEYAALSNKRHFYYNEDEGEIDLDRVFDGYDAIFLDREDRESRPGLRLMIEFAFAWTTDEEVISQYGAWVASLIKSLESSGFDLVVDLWINLDQLFMGDSYSQRTNVFLRVKQENENSNFTEWSALFGKGGFRRLGFLAICLAAQQTGNRAQGNFGNTIGDRDWNVTYNREVQQVTINVNQRAGDEFLPIEKLNDSAIDCGLIRQPLKVTGLVT